MIAYIKLLERCNCFLLSIYDAEFSEQDEYVEREALIKDLEAAMAEQAKPRKIDVQQSILIDDISYAVQKPVFDELVRLHSALQANPNNYQAGYDAATHMAKKDIRQVREELDTVLSAYKKLYTKEQAKPQEPMSEDDIERIFQSVADSDDEVHIRFARAIEAYICNDHTACKVSHQQA